MLTGGALEPDLQTRQLRDAGHVLPRVGLHHAQLAVLQAVLGGEAPGGCVQRASAGNDQLCSESCGNQCSSMPGSMIQQQQVAAECKQVGFSNTAAATNAGQCMESRQDGRSP